MAGRASRVVSPSRRDLVPTFRAEAERHTAAAKRIEREVATARARRRRVHRRVRIAVRIVAGCVVVLLGLTFASLWHTDLRDVGS